MIRTALGSLLRSLGHSLAAAPSAPAEPTLAVVNDGTGTTVTATITGAAGASHRLLYRAAGDLHWTEGLARTGNGTIVQTGLASTVTYTVIAVSTIDGVRSYPSAPWTLAVVTAAAGQIVYNIESISEDKRRSEMDILCTEAEP